MIGGFSAKSLLKAWCIQCILYTGGSSCINAYQSSIIHPQQTCKRNRFLL